MFAKEGPAEQELARQGLSAGDVAVGFYPHTTDRLPATFGHPVLYGVEQLRVVLADVVVDLGLALSEMVVGELLHEPERGMEGTAGFAAGLTQRPEPGDVDVGVAGGEYVHVHGRTRPFDAGAQHGVSLGNAGIETLAERLPNIEDLESVVKGIEQMTLGRLVIKALGNAKGRSGTGDEVPGRLVDLDYGAGTHEQLSVKFALAAAASAGPAVQGEEVRGAVFPSSVDQNFLMVAVAGGNGNFIHVGKELRVAEIAGFSQRQVECNGRIQIPVRRYLEIGAQNVVGHPPTPIGVWFDHGPAAIVHIRTYRRLIGGISEPGVAKG